MIITRTPLRISFVGGGTDLKCFYKDHGGAIVNAAIDKYVYVMVRERLLDQPRTESEFEVEAKKLVGVENVEMFTWSDLPCGAGLGSSGSYLVGMLHALHAYKGDKIELRELAEEAYMIETERLRAPVGKQDQYIAAFGGLKYWEFAKCGVVSWREPMDIKRVALLNTRLMLFFLGVTRESSYILKEQVKNNDKIVNNLLYVRDQAEHLAAFAKGDDLDLFGRIMNRGWIAKKNFAKNISNSTIDDLYEKALGSGSIGGKVVGAGGGGFMLLYVQYGDKKKELRDALGLTEIKFNIVHKGTEVIHGL